MWWISRLHVQFAHFDYRRVTYGSAIPDDSGDGGQVRRETLRLLHVRRVDILRAVREEIETLRGLNTRQNLALALTREA